MKNNSSWSKMIYVVLGMHKSGTTLVSEILHHSGIYMGDGLDEHTPYDRGNKYECTWAQALNSAILNAEPFGPDFNSIDFPAPGQLDVTDDVREQIQEFIRKRDLAFGHWGFKDPRTCLTYSVWASELPEHKIIVVYRPPAEVWPHYRYDNLGWLYANPLQAWKFIGRWCEHNISILDHLRNTQMDFVVLSYQALMTTPDEFSRLETFVDLKLKDRRRKNLYRNRQREFPLLNMVTQLYQGLVGHKFVEIIEQFEVLRQE